VYIEIAVGTQKGFAMQIAIIPVIALHAVTAIFWAGSTAALARMGGHGAGPLFPAQMGAAAMAFATGGVLWGLLHRGLFDAPEQVLAFGIAAALAAAGVQAATVGPVRRRLEETSGEARKPLEARVRTGQRVASGLLVVTAICMVVARYV
jgi:hypothetical protein